MLFSRFSVAVIAALCPTVIVATSCDSKGGYAVRKSDHCDGDTPVDCGGFLAKRCCPSGFYCKETDNGYCCPKDQDCFEDVDNVPKCPDGPNGPNKGFSLWQYNNSAANEAWCCGASSYGVALLDDSGAWAAVACSSLGDGLSAKLSGYAETTATSASYPSTCSTVAPKTTSSESSSSSSSSSIATKTASQTGEDKDSGETSSVGPPEKKKSSSISGGAIAGIVIGAIAGVALIAGGLFMVLRRRKRNNSPNAAELDAAQYQHSHQSPSPHAEKTPTPHTGTSSIAQTSAYTPPPHIPASNEPLELDGGGTEIHEISPR